MENVDYPVKPGNSLELFWKKFPSACRILDLGCGRGGDSIFLSEKGFSLTAVDCSAEVIGSLKKEKDSRGLDSLELIISDIQDFSFEKNFYQVIICRNVLNFLKREVAENFLQFLKDSLPIGGFAIVEVFNEADPSFLSEKPFAFYFKEQELLTLFKDYKIIYYLENIIFDPGHPDFRAPHRHGVSRIVAVKCQ
jgi:tellurite methyltransferase